MRASGVPAHAANQTKFCIGGDWVDPVSAALLWVENPATEAGIAQVVAGGAEDIDREGGVFGNEALTALKLLA